MDKKIITISREFGSGGRTIGKLVAKELDVPYYDKALVKQVAVESGLNETFIEQEGEDAPVNSLLAMFSSRGSQGSLNGLSIDDFLWVMQRSVILDLAEKGPCVIIGRCADYILRDRKDCLNVFIHAGMEVRAERIVRLYGETDQNPKKRLETKDKRRKVHYKYYTDQEWGMSQNYHLTMDSGEIGIETCVELITDIIKNPNHSLKE